MLTIKNLVKNYKNQPAVKGVNLEVPGGELFGFLGPNGAGKTTTIKMIAGLLKPTRGIITIGGYDIARQPREAKSILGYIPDRPFIYEKLTGREYLAFIADLYGMDAAVAAEKARRFLDFFDLGAAADKLVEGYSHGMKQKVIISGALLHDPQLVVVDEPMVGLDPKGARQVKQLFRDLCDKGACVFMSTHSLGIAQTMCDRIGIIQHGTVIAQGSLDELRGQVQNDHEHLEDIFLELTGDAHLEQLSGL
ncbi:MAG: ATP-binding cassette domain-containing protein, partial [Nitrospinaceae bacterium]|nr:ABC transporter ATP-binding protein [Nitrospinaceae bacterium]NIR55993.1 ABC transporter ATP-binding protein [Nitrospinaceae bacterium]NIS86436.1 ABC transporter ATP-binding protein [Nitrospinaceae bacterium]NIT83274.1 ABC transporter ATP-binding protein [Nitrospinaceae bacterium]NIU45481.1 ABC transporter ATP-binding protein [Nitrospinaceae bacterium]